MFPKEAPGNFATLRSRMRLVQDGVDGLSNADMSYVTSGYAPLTGRLVQAVLTQGGVSQGGRLLGLSRRDREDPERAGAGDNADGGAPAAGAGHAEEGALVVLIGGATYTELAAIRQLKHLEDFGYEIVLLVSDLTNGTKIIDDLEIPVKPIPLSPKQN